MFSRENTQGIGTAGTSGVMMPYTYGPYGEPASWAGSRFRYTGQIALPEAQLYHYKARVYDPIKGQFLQTDPIGYGDGMNVYAYTRGDPVNASDPEGLANTSGADHLLVHTNKFDSLVAEVVITAQQARTTLSMALSGGGGGAGQAGHSGSDGTSDSARGAPKDATVVEELVITAQKKAGSLMTRLQVLKKLVCAAPPIAAGGGLDAYAGPGASVSAAGSINPRNGQVSVSFDAGAGVGIGGGGRVSTGTFVGIGKGSSEDLPIVGVGVNINGTAVVGGGVTGTYQLIGSNKGDYGVAATAGPEISANVNVSGHGQFNFPALYSQWCGTQ